MTMLLIVLVWIVLVVGFAMFMARLQNDKRLWLAAAIMLPLALARPDAGSAQEAGYEGGGGSMTMPLVLNAVDDPAARFMGCLLEHAAPKIAMLPVPVPHETIDAVRAAAYEA